MLAGGRGERMAAERNKALLELGGRPLLLHAVDTFRACCDRLVVAAAATDVDEVRRLVPDAAVVAGGATRQGSEWNAIQALRAGLGDGVLAIHDAARPLVAEADVLAVFAAAEEHGAAMLASPAALPALEVAEGTVLGTYPASALWRAQTPQAARAGWLTDAYARAVSSGFDGTDTAAVLERAGYRVRIVAATAANPKITIPADLALAERILAERAGDS